MMTLQLRCYLTDLYRVRTLLYSAYRASQKYKNHGFGFENFKRCFNFTTKEPFEHPHPENNIKQDL